MHTSDDDPCEQAKFHECTCSDCIGALHRWRGLMQSVHDPRARAAWSALHTSTWTRRLQLDDRQTHRVDATQDVVDRQSRPTQRAIMANVRATRARSRSRNSATNRVAASDFVLAGIIEELARVSGGALVIEARSILDAIKGVAESITASVTSAELRSGIAASHLWCELLARSIQSVTSSDQKDPFSRTFTAYFDSLEGRTMEAVVRTNVLDTLASHLDSNTATSDRAQLKDSIRIAASFICPAPESHQTVSEQCFTPLAQQLLKSQQFQLPVDVLRAYWR